MAPNGNGKEPTATELLVALNGTNDNAEQHRILGRMLALHFESDARWRVRVTVTLTGLVAVVVALGGALLTHAVG